MRRKRIYDIGIVFSKSKHIFFNYFRLKSRIWVKTRMKCVYHIGILFSRSKLILDYSWVKMRRK